MLEETQAPAAKKRCSTCRKKLGLMVFKCSCCEKEFCTHHRMPEEHACVADFRAIAHEKNSKKVAGDAISDTHHYLKI